MPDGQDRPLARPRQAPVPSPRLAGRRDIYTIRELSAATGATLRALRYYEDQGLLSAGRSVTGARAYDGAQRRQAELITRLRRLGMPLKAIRAATAADCSPSQRDRLIGRFLASEIARTQRRLEILTQAAEALTSAPR